MGYIRHHAIVVTCWEGDQIERAHCKAIEIGLPVSNVVGPQVNGYSSFFIAPDGSKEGWEDSEDGNEKREAFKAWLPGDCSYCEWVEVAYGHDDNEALITDSAWQSED